MSRFFSERFSGLVPYTPGEQPQERKYIKLNTNENPYPPSPAVLEAIRREADNLRLYPDPDADAARNAVAEYYNNTLGLSGDAVLDKTNLFIGNGSDEMLDVAFKTFTDWGDNTYLQATLGKGWRTMTKDEFVYVFNTRTSGSSVFGIADGRYTTATINTDDTGVKGLILFPDGITIAASEVTTAGAINGKGTVTQCTTAQWAALAEKGCVFLPAAGFILSGTGIGHGDIADYWSSTAADASKAYNLGFNFGVPGAVVNTAGTLGYNYGLSVRLVCEVPSN